MRLINYPALFATDPTAQIVPLTEALTNKKKGREYFRNFFADGTGGLNMVASCDCGRLTGEYYLGHRCPNCGYKVTTGFITNVRYRYWLYIPDEFPELFHPQAYQMLRHLLGRYGGRYLLDLILDIDQKLPPALEGKIEQGIGPFRDHYEETVRTVVANYASLNVSAKRKAIDNLLRFFQKHSDRLFIRQIPIMNPALHVMTKAGRSSYIDKAAPLILKCAITLSQLIYRKKFSVCNQSTVEQHMFDIYEAFTQYATDIRANQIPTKPGDIRKTIMGARCHFTFRGVIAPIVGPHRIDDLYLPWRIALELYHSMVWNHLVNRHHHSLREANRRIDRAMTQYDPLIDEIFKTIIRESPNGRGLPVIFGRMPTMRIGAWQFFYVTKIIASADHVRFPRIVDNTVHLSPLATSPSNADYDGDAMNGEAIHEYAIATIMHDRMHPCVNLLDRTDIQAVSSSICITPQAAIACHCWLNEPPEYPHEDYRVFDAKEFETLLRGGLHAYHRHR